MENEILKTDDYHLLFDRVQQHLLSKTHFLFSNCDDEEFDNLTFWIEQDIELLKKLKTLVNIFEKTL